MRRRRVKKVDVILDQHEGAEDEARGFPGDAQGSHFRGLI